MIRHMVFFKVKPTVSDDAIINAFQQLFFLKKKLPGILNIVGGQCRFHQRKGEAYITHAFTIDFENEDAYAQFLSDPITQSAKGCFNNIALKGWDGFYGFDIGNANNVFPSPMDKYRVPRPRLLPPGAID